MYECAAITIYLCDSHPESGLAPALDDPTRSLFLQTLVYFSNTVQIAFQQYYYPQRFTYSEDGLQSALERGVQRLHQVWKIVDDQIGDGQWVLGDQFSAADIYLYMLTTWFVPEDGHPDLSSLSNVSRVVSKVAERPSVQRVYGS
jgi:glutathione S-transferase